MSGAHLVDVTGWDSLFVPSKTARVIRFENHLYRISKALKVWSPLCVFSQARLCALQSHGENYSKGERYKAASEKDRDASGFRTIVQRKNMVVVGMGEFAGDAFPHKLSSSRAGKPVYR